MTNRVFSVEFISQLVKYYNDVEDKLSPLGDFESARKTVLNDLALRRSTDSALHHACDDEGFQSLYETTVTIKDEIIPKSWDDRSVQDWMFTFNRQIWAINARTDDFGPVKSKDESEEEWHRRRVLGAKNALEQLESAEIPLLSNAREFMQAIADLNEDNAPEIVGALLVVGNESSLAAACPMLMKRASTIAKGQVKRLDRIGSRLDELYRRLSKIANEPIPVSTPKAVPGAGIPAT